MSQVVSAADFLFKHTVTSSLSQQIISFVTLNYDMLYLNTWFWWFAAGNETWTDLFRLPYIYGAFSSHNRTKQLRQVSVIKMKVNTRVNSWSCFTGNPPFWERLGILYVNLFATLTCRCAGSQMWGTKRRVYLQILCGGKCIFHGSRVHTYACGIHKMWVYLSSRVCSCLGHT